MWERHRKDCPRIPRLGRKSIFYDSGGVRGAETWVESTENRQTRVRIGIPRFRGYQAGGGVGRPGRILIFAGPGGVEVG